MIHPNDATHLKRVIYLPSKAQGDITSKHAERGTINNLVADPNATTVFVKFDKDLTKLGWDKTVGQSCYLRDLIPL